MKGRLERTYDKMEQKDVLILDKTDNLDKTDLNDDLNEEPHKREKADTHNQGSRLKKIRKSRYFYTAGLALNTPSQTFS